MGRVDGIYILQIIVKRFERLFSHRSRWLKAASRRPVCIVLAIVAILLAIFFVARMAVPQLITSLGIVVKATPQIYHATEQWINTIICQRIPMYCDRILFIPFRRTVWLPTSVIWERKAVSMLCIR